MIKWKPTQRIDTTHELPNIAPPMDIKFKTMIELIKDASKYYDAGEKELSNRILKVLSEHITKTT